MGLIEFKSNFLNVGPLSISNMGIIILFNPGTICNSGLDKKLLTWVTELRKICLATGCRKHPVTFFVPMAVSNCPQCGI